MSRSTEERLEDIDTAITRCLDYRASLEAQDSTIQDMAFDAILRNLGIIGEAVRDLPGVFTAQHPDIPWPAIAGLRNVIVHEYFRIDATVIADILDNHLRTVRRAVRPVPHPPDQD